DAIRTCTVAITSILAASSFFLSANALVASSSISTPTAASIVATASMTSIHPESAANSPWTFSREAWVTTSDNGKSPTNHPDQAPSQAGATATSPLLSSSASLLKRTVSSDHDWYCGASGGDSSHHH
ncbi:hypothetical protein BX616_008089, partial [Lobosporangium transversale]